MNIMAASPKFLDDLITKKYRLRLYRIPIYWKILKTGQPPPPNAAMPSKMFVWNRGDLTCGVLYIA